MTVFYNDRDYLDAAAANKSRLNAKISHPIIRKGREWQEYKRPALVEPAVIERQQAYHGNFVKNYQDEKLLNIMKTYNLTSGDVARMLKKRKSTIERRLRDGDVLLPWDEVELRRKICNDTPPVKCKKPRGWDKNQWFSLKFQNYVVVEKGKAKKLFDYFNSNKQVRLKIFKENGFWQLTYTYDKNPNKSAILSRSDNLSEMLLLFIDGAMRGMCCGYTVERAS